ncbi:hypothetical protein ACHWQZ_G013865 [Mnemiopsis leidyi]
MTEKSTPYQGKKRTFGFFRCRDCDSSWQSAYSWANCGQECKICRKLVYPYSQRPLRKQPGKNQKKHLEELCEKCKELGYSCTQYRRGFPPQNGSYRRSNRG